MWRPSVDDETGFSNLRPWCEKKKKVQAKQLRTFPWYPSEILPLTWESEWTSISEKDKVMFEVLLNLSRALRLGKRLNKSMMLSVRLWLHTWQDKHWNILGQSFRQKAWIFEERRHTFVRPDEEYWQGFIYWLNFDTGSRLTIKGQWRWHDTEGNQWRQSIDAGLQCRLSESLQETDLRDK